MDATLDVGRGIGCGGEGREESKEDGYRCNVGCDDSDGVETDDDPDCGATAD